jgi:hypothetical protein
MSTTTIIDFAEKLRESLEAKINEFRLNMRGSYSLKEAGMLMIKIQALEWIQGRIQDLVNIVTRNWPVYHK